MDDGALDTQVEDTLRILTYPEPVTPGVPWLVTVVTLQLGPTNISNHPTINGTVVSACVLPERRQAATSQPTHRVSLGALGVEGYRATRQRANVVRARFAVQKWLSIKCLVTPSAGHGVFWVVCTGQLITTDKLQSMAAWAVSLGEKGLSCRAGALGLLANADANARGAYQERVIVAASHDSAITRSSTVFTGLVAVCLSIVATNDLKARVVSGRIDLCLLIDRTRDGLGDGEWWDGLGEGEGWDGLGEGEGCR